MLDNPGANRAQPPAMQATCNPALFYDGIDKSNAGPPTPQALAPQNPLSTDKVDHWRQDWYVGGSGFGGGMRVQRDTVQRYEDHGRDENIVTPFP